jgi:hypothetical protein
MKTYWLNACRKNRILIYILNKHGFTVLIVLVCASDLVVF